LDLEKRGEKKGERERERKWKREKEGEGEGEGEGEEREAIGLKGRQEQKKGSNVRCT